MRQKKVSPSVVAQGETTETGATFEQAATSNNHNSINTAQHQTDSISRRFLCAPGRQKLKPPQRLLKGRYCQNDK